MKFGVILPIWRLSVQEAEALTLTAEAVGLDGVFTPDHILAPAATAQHYGPNWPDPFALLAYLAGRTNRIDLGASAIVLPYRNPLVAAKAGATVDQVSGGRFIMAIGVGWDAEEFENLNLPFAERGRMSDEYLRIIKAAWTSDLPAYAGEYYRFANAAFSPRPLQQPHPPIWAGSMPGAIPTPALRRVAALCDGWHPLALSLEQLEAGYAQIKALAAEQGRTDPIQLAPRNMLSLTDQPLGSDRPAFHGTAEQVTADVRRAAELGADYLTFDFPGGDVAAMQRLMERLSAEVRPKVG
jgi:probable F420-dependent oxidoreductase